ncbi:MAG: methionine--tRNA ligase subunit beta [Candidatus Aenigmatarchaeota archaeon]|nr:methionine--tRNA ligase subunit beta [Candidatus Aenigmarchaeota archaeon]
MNEERKEEITIEEFQKIDLRVGKIINAEKIENADKLLKILVDLGNEKRTLIAGIAKCYKPEELINKKVVVVTNLKPKKIRGIESKGMLLAAIDKNENPILITVEKDIEVGAKIR